MSLFSTLSVSLSGVQTASAQLQITSNNIANAGKEGFTKKSAILGSANLGDIGGGTKIEGFERASNIVLFRTLTSAKSDAGLRSAQDNYLSQIQTLLGTSSSDQPDLVKTVTNFTNSWAQLQAEPESLINQRQVVQDANNLCKAIQSTAEDVEALDRQCFAEIGSTVSDFNSYLSQIKDLNLKIAEARNSGQSSGDLEDQRDTLILKVSEMTGVTILERPQGQVALYSSTGYQLVDSGSYRSFTYNGTDITSDSNPGLSLNSALGGGKLQGLIDFRATSTPVSTDPGVNVIQKLRSQLDAFADSFLDTVTTATSGESTFAAAYNAAASGAGTDLANGFFTGADRTDIAVNASLLDGSATIKIAAAAGVSDAMLDSTRTFTATGLNVTATSYATLMTSILTGFQQAASNIAALKTTAETQTTYLQQKLTNETNVNVDTEMVNLVTIQNTYAASARCITVVNELLSMLMNLM